MTRKAEWVGMTGKTGQNAKPMVLQDTIEEENAMRFKTF